MPTDELRGELTTLADEIEPFAGDVHAVHRRVRRRRIVGGTLVAAVVVVVAASTVAVAGHRDADKVHVSGTGAKEVSAARIRSVDVIVVPANAAVRTELDASPLVRHYAVLPRARRIAGLTSGDTRTALCALENNDGYAVQATVMGSGIGPVPSTDLAGAVRAYNVTDTYGFDVEIFLDVNASAQEISTVQAAVASDRDVNSFDHLDQTDAYTVFKREFADQPDILKDTKPSDLPDSFRIALEPGVPVDRVVERYNNVSAVETVISRARTLTPIRPEAMDAASSFLSSPRTAEIFLAVGASTPQVDAVRAALAADRGIGSSEFIDQDQAYSIFKHDFADQTELVQSTKASDLPVSFRITMKDGESAAATADRYKRFDGVETVLTADDTYEGFAAMYASACTNPK